jgi:hypothetical protein
MNDGSMLKRSQRGGRSFSEQRETLGTGLASASEGGRQRVDVIPIVQVT